MVTRHLVSTIDNVSGGVHGLCGRHETGVAVEQSEPAELIVRGWGREVYPMGVPG